MSKVFSLTQLTGTDGNMTSDEVVKSLLFETCESRKCVDLKTLFNIFDDEEFYTQKFNITLVPEVGIDKQRRYEGENIIVNNDIKEITIYEFVCKFY